MCKEYMHGPEKSLAVVHFKLNRMYILFVVIATNIMSEYYINFFVDLIKIVSSYKNHPIQTFFYQNN